MAGVDITIAGVSVTVARVAPGGRVRAMVYLVALDVRWSIRTRSGVSSGSPRTAVLSGDVVGALASLLIRGSFCPGPAIFTSVTPPDVDESLSRSPWTGVGGRAAK